MGRRLRTGRGFSPVRRSSIWLGSAVQTAVDSLAAATVTLDQSIVGAQIQALGNGTIARTRGTLWVASDQVIAQEDPFGALGMIVITEAARVAGAVPGPGTTPDADQWFVHLFWKASMQVSAAAPASLAGGSFWSRYEFDSKAQRKVEDGQAIAVVMENNSAAHGARFLINFRMLYRPI